MATHSSIHHHSLTVPDSWFILMRVLTFWGLISFMLVFTRQLPSYFHLGGVSTQSSFLFWSKSEQTCSQILFFLFSLKSLVLVYKLKDAPLFSINWRDEVVLLSESAMLVTGEAGREVWTAQGKWNNGALHLVTK